MVIRGSAALVRRVLLPFVVTALLVVGLTGYLVSDADADADAESDRCARFAQDSAGLLQRDSGSGARTVVIGDSYSVGLGLDDPAASWPSQLSGRVHVAGFSGSGFSAGASGCGRVSFADRAAAAVEHGADFVIVEGGLNDVDQSDAAITAGFTRLMTELAGHRVVVVGPVTAPARAVRVPRVDALLASLAEQYDATYLSMAELGMTYLDDDLHLTRAGHQAFGQAVAREIAVASD